MTFTALHNTILRLAKPLAESLGLDIWGLELLQGGRPVVRLYVDAPGNVSPEKVSIDQCAHLSRLLGLALEVENTFPGAYILEVSSPGLSRIFFTLAQMRSYIGDTVETSLRDALPEWPLRKKFCGQLTGVGDTTLTLNVEDDTVTIAWDNIRRAVRVHIFAEPQKPGKKSQRAVKKADEK